MRFAIVRALFNADITGALLDGALRAFADGGIKRRNIELIEVPGAFELPVAALWLARSKRFDAVVCLGCVIRGETPHFIYVAGEAARGISRVALDTAVPVIFGVLTTDTHAQALARAAAGRAPEQHRPRKAAAPGRDHLAGDRTASRSQGNKGYEAAQSAMQMATLRRRFDR